jgi:hypothetical protein
MLAASWKETECCGQGTCDAPRSQIPLSDASSDRLALCPKPSRLAALLAFVVRNALLLRGCWRRRLWPRLLASQYLNRLGEGAGVDVLNELDDVTGDITDTTKEDLFSDIDREAIMPAAHRARPAAVNDTTEMDAAPRTFVLNADGSSALDDVRRDPS